MTEISVVVPDGSMQETINRLMTGAGFFVKIEKMRTGRGVVPNVDWICDVSIQRPQEIPTFLERGIFDIGFAGQDWMAERESNLLVLLEMPIGRGGNSPVKIVLAVKERSGFHCPEDLQGRIVATEYVELTKRFFLKKGVGVEVFRSYGKTENKINLRVADAIVDVTESGDSLRENGLIVIGELMTSSTVIAVSPNAFADGNKRPFLECFARLIEGAFVAERYVLITANVPEKKLKEAGAIMGGLKSPSCLKTLNDDWFALQAVVLRENEADIIFRLLEIKVDDIFVTRDIPLVMMRS